MIILSKILQKEILLNVIILGKDIWIKHLNRLWPPASSSKFCDDEWKYILSISWVFFLFSLHFTFVGVYFMWAFLILQSEKQICHIFSLFTFCYWIEPHLMKLRLLQGASVGEFGECDGGGSSRSGVNVNANKLYDSLQIEIQRRQLKRI